MADTWNGRRPYLTCQYYDLSDSFRQARCIKLLLGVPRRESFTNNKLTPART